MERGIIIALVLWAAAYSALGATKTSTSKTPPHVAASAQSPQTPPDERGTVQQPFVVSVVPPTPSPPTPAETRYRRYEQEERPQNERLLASGTVWLVIVTAGLALFTALMWWWTRRLAVHAISSAAVQQEQTASSLRIAEEANRLTNAMLLAQQRPWVSLRVNPASPLSFTKDGWFLAIDYTLKNIGGSPAIRTSFTATMIPFAPNSWPAAALKGRSIAEMPTLGTDAATELRKLAESAMNAVKVEVGFGNTIFPGEAPGGTFGIYGNSPLFDRAKELECYSGQFVLLACVGYGSTLGDTAHVTAKAFSIYKQVGPGQFAAIDLMGETLGPGTLCFSDFPDVKTDFVT